MALTKCNVPSDVIGSLATRAEERGLTPQEFKDKFDEMPEGIKQYINEDLTEELDAHIADYLVHKAENVTEVDGVHGLKMEQGTWTPTVDGVTTSPTVSYTIQRGTYDRVGNIAKCSFFTRFTAVDGSGTLKLTGLPFASKTIDESGVVAIFHNNNVKIDVQGLFIIDTTASARFRNGHLNLQVSAINGGTSVDIAGSITYRIA